MVSQHSKYVVLRISDAWTVCDDVTTSTNIWLESMYCMSCVLVMFSAIAFDSWNATSLVSSMTMIRCVWHKLNSSITEHNKVMIVSVHSSVNMEHFTNKRLTCLNLMQVLSPVDDHRSTCLYTLHTERLLRRVIPHGFVPGQWTDSLLATSTATCLVSPCSPKLHVSTE